MPNKYHNNLDEAEKKLKEKFKNDSGVSVSRTKPKGFSDDEKKRIKKALEELNK